MENLFRKHIKRKKSEKSNDIFEKLNSNKNNCNNNENINRDYNKISCLPINKEDNPCFLKAFRASSACPYNINRKEKRVQNFSNGIFNGEDFTEDGKIKSKNTKNISNTYRSSVFPENENNKDLKNVRHSKNSIYSNYSYRTQIYSLPGGVKREGNDINDDARHRTRKMFNIEDNFDKLSIKSNNNELNSYPVKIRYGKSCRRQIKDNDIFLTEDNTENINDKIIVNNEFYDSSKKMIKDNINYNENDLFNIFNTEKNDDIRENKHKKMFKENKIFKNDFQFY